MLGIDIQQILLHLLNFVILFTGLYVLLYGPVKKFMDSRIEEYKKQDGSVGTRFNARDKTVDAIKRKAAAAGIPYQTYVNVLLDKAAFA